MAKLQTPSKSGFNAGDSYNVKYIRIDKIGIDPEFSALFKLNEKVVEAICESILKEGFHKEEPVTIWAGQNVLVDGHQRYNAAKKADILEIPYIEKQFADRDEAILYSFERQAIRRNLTGEEILYAASMLPDKKAKNGEGRSADVWSKRLGISLSTVYRASTVNKNASEEDLQAIRDGKTSVQKVYNKLKESKEVKEPKEVKNVENDSRELPSNVSFLKGAVILLVESKQTQAAELLINHFLTNNEKQGFYDLLPEAISAQLPEFAVSVHYTN